MSQSDAGDGKSLSDRQNYNFNEEGNIEIDAHEEVMVQKSGGVTHD